MNKSTVNFYFFSRVCDDFLNFYANLGQKIQKALHKCVHD